jgi:hypothetical protein
MHLFALACLLTNMDATTNLLQVQVRGDNWPYVLASERDGFKGQNPLSPLSMFFFFIQSCHLLKLNKTTLLSQTRGYICYVTHPATMPPHHNPSLSPNEMEGPSMALSQPPPHPKCKMRGSGFFLLLTPPALTPNASW